MSGSSPVAPGGHQAVSKATCSTYQNVWTMVAPQGLCCPGCGDTGMVTPSRLETRAV